MVFEIWCLRCAERRKEVKDGGGLKSVKDED